MSYWYLYFYILYFWVLIILCNCFRALKRLQSEWGLQWANHLFTEHFYIHVSTNPVISLAALWSAAFLQTKACEISKTAGGNWISWESFFYLYFSRPTDLYLFLSLLLFFFLTFCPSCFQKDSTPRISVFPLSIPNACLKVLIKFLNKRNTVL